MTAASTYSARSPEDYLKTRLDYKTDVYTRKGDRYRKSYLAMSSLAAVAGATVPVLINLSNVPTIVPTLLSLLVTVLVTLEGVFHFREHWKNYDLMKSFLRQESCLYQANAGPYRNKAQADSFVLLVERVEDAIAKERAQTIEMRTSRWEEPAANSAAPAKPQPAPLATAAGSAV
ncbi:DUF4231 domain-containing protein [Ramlibacter sp. G-1-2-2]|uniref:DUF4231 domain-containing protein n=1 Tax=Ramlibacter agri TaxID=2728837 RepID=A0A848HAI1_9BURK|nr:DUF4231 domain-containing protein [Ramlibacter agri]NML47467.1 DUF4231 domain-containing protein [Ramlibacter agri]